MNTHLQMELIFLAGMFFVFIVLPLLALYIIARVIMAAIRRSDSERT